MRTFAVDTTVRRYVPMDPGHRVALRDAQEELQQMTITASLGDQQRASH